MAKPGKTFSESWHRIADLKVCLRSTVKMRKQFFRRKQWYILNDPFNNSFFRLRPEAYDFISRLRPDRTVEEVWLECLKRNPDEAPGQEDVLHLLTQLHFSNLLYSEIAMDSAKVFQRYEKRRKQEIQSKLMSIMFMRIPLFDPDHFLKRLLPYIKFLIGPVGIIVWLTVVGIAAKMIFDRFDEVTEQAQGFLAPGNLFLVYTGLLVVKALHEFSHALICRYYGGEVHTMGVMLLVFTPLPYMDATASWSFRSRWQRAFVGAAGIIMELFIAGIATIIWANTGTGVLHSLVYNIMFVASVSTILFNANPLLRFDGYYILSDLLDIPNLHTTSSGHMRHLAERYLMGYKDSTSPAQSMKEKVWLTIFGILSSIYRIVVFAGIILFISEKFLLAGMIMALICIISWGIVPVYRLLKYLISSPRLAKTRPRAIAVATGIIVVIILSLGVAPFPNRFRAPGVLEAAQYSYVLNEAPGYVDSFPTKSGALVKPGTPLIKLSNKEIILEIKSTKAQMQETLAMEMHAVSQAKENLKPIRKRLETIKAKLKDIEKQHKALIVRASHPGIWVAPAESDIIGRWVSKGTVLGEVVNNKSFRFTAAVSQNDAANLFTDEIEKVEVRLHGNAGDNISVSKYQIIPFQNDRLPSASLGWLAGGEISVTGADGSGEKTTEPFFLISASVIPDENVTFLQRRSGKLRLTTHPKPLLFQWGDKFLQLLQERYQI